MFTVADRPESDANADRYANAHEHAASHAA
jgi:hypothetical protein